MIEIRLAQQEEDMRNIFFIRKKVFVDEQHVDPLLEFDGLDGKAEHVVLFFDEKPVGCARLRFIGGKAKLERVAVLKDYRGRGLGKAIVEFLVDYCKKRGMREVYLHSQLPVRGFYAKCGFVERGTMFVEADIKHIEMFKDLEI